jgi:hypothetical protein
VLLLETISQHRRQRVTHSMSVTASAAAEGPPVWAQYNSA